MKSGRKGSLPGEEEQFGKLERLLDQRRKVAAINKYCPHSGKPVAPDSLTTYRGLTVGFCNPGCRDDFAAAPANFPQDLHYFDVLIKEQDHAASS